MPGDRIPHSVLPTAEIGTAQQEIPVTNAASFYAVVCKDYGYEEVVSIWKDEYNAVWAAKVDCGCVVELVELPDNLANKLIR
jgi:hypothetical protein